MNTDQVSRFSPSTEVLERFWQKVEKSDGCWIWTASKRSKGYGAFVYPHGDRTVQGRAHIFSYLLHKGSINELCVLHSCDNPACVRPDHLSLGTKADNNRDMHKKGRNRSGGSKCGTNGRWPHGESHHGAKLTTADIVAIRIKYRAGDTSYSKLGIEFGVNGSAISKIVNYKAWKHVCAVEGEKC